MPRSTQVLPPSPHLHRGPNVGDKLLELHTLCLCKLLINTVTSCKMDACNGGVVDVCSNTRHLLVSTIWDFVSLGGRTPIVNPGWPQLSLVSATKKKIVNPLHNAPPPTAACSRVPRHRRASAAGRHISSSYSSPAYRQEKSAVRGGPNQPQFPLAPAAQPLC